MNKKDILKELAAISKESQKTCDAVLVAFTEVVKNALAKGEKVSLVGFGTFEVVERSAREGRNPQTGESIHIPATKAPKFKAGKMLKDCVKA